MFEPPIKPLATRVREATQRVAGMVRARSAGTPVPNDPAKNEHYVGRPPIRYPLTLPVQNHANGFVIRQAGAGRAIVPGYITIAPDQSVTVMPDGRIIARPLPTSAVDARQVIR